MLVSACLKHTRTQHLHVSLFLCFLQVAFFALCAKIWSLARSFWPWRPRRDLTPLDTWCRLLGFRLAIGTCLTVTRIRRKRQRLKPELFKTKHIQNDQKSSCVFLADMLAVPSILCVLCCLSQVKMMKGFAFKILTPKDITGVACSTWGIRVFLIQITKKCLHRPGSKHDWRASSSGAGEHWKVGIQYVWAAYISRRNMHKQ